MDKSQYAAKLATEMKNAGLNLTRNNAEIFLDAMAQAMTEGLARDRKLTLSNFGTFIVSRFGAKIIKSPRGDNKQFFMPPTDVIKWRPSMKVRDRAASSRVSDEIYDKLVKGEIVEELPEEKEKQNFETASEKKLGRFEVRVDIAGTTGREHIADERSPISRLAKRLIEDFVSSKNDKLEIRPGKNQMLFVYYQNNSASNVKYLPSVSHQIIIEKFKSMAKNGTGNGAIKIDDTREINLSSLLTPNGESLILQRI
jgi:nucleoid DNA-binding protein